MLVDQANALTRYEPGLAVVGTVCDLELGAGERLGDVDGGLGVEGEGPRHQLRPPARQRHEDDQLVLDVLVHAAAALHRLQELLGSLDPGLVRGHLGRAERGAPEDAAGGGPGHQHDAAAVVRTAVGVLLVGENVRGVEILVPDDVTAAGLQVVHGGTRHLLRHAERQVTRTETPAIDLLDSAGICHGDRPQLLDWVDEEVDDAATAGHETFPHHLVLKVDSELVEVGEEDLRELVNLRRHVTVGAAAQVEGHGARGEHGARQRDLRQETHRARRVGVRGEAARLQGPGPQHNLGGAEAGALQVASAEVPHQLEAALVLALEAGLGSARPHLHYPDGPGEQRGEAGGHPEHLAPALHHRPVDLEEVTHGQAGFVTRCSHSGHCDH